MVAGRVVDVRFGIWDGPIQLAYHIDGLSLMFALMGAGIGTAVLLYAVTYMDHEKGTTRFFSLILIFIAGLIHLVYTADLFILYLNWELVGLCSFLLVGFWYNQPDAAYGARKVFTITHLAGYGLLAAVVILFHRTGSTLWTDPKVQGALTTGIFLLMIVSAVAKSVQFPLNTWIPFAMFAPTPVSALLHAACYVKAGVYLIARLHSMGAWPESWSADRFRYRGGYFVDRCAFRPGAEGPQAAAGLQHHQPDRIHGAGIRDRNPSGDCRGPVPLPESRAIQRLPVSLRRFRSACLRDAGYGPFRRPRTANAAHHGDLAGCFSEYRGSAAVEWVCQQMAAF